MTAMSPEPLLDREDPDAFERYARRAGFLEPSEALVELSKAGEGNMNLALRVRTSKRTFILKQSRPWVEKYPQIPAPAERALVELAFYEATRSRPDLASAMPNLLGADETACVLTLEDLGPAQDLTTIYEGPGLTEIELDALVSFLETLHRPWPELRGRSIFENRKMRALNHEHIFRFPLDPSNGLDLDGFTVGLAAVAEPLIRHETYRAEVASLGELYLRDGATLLHGDYFPGSWLRTTDGVRVIDPEFCFLGPRAFDIGVMLAHLYFADAIPEHRSRVLALCETSEQECRLARRFAGVEIMRRLIGVAQLPITPHLEVKARLLDLSKELVLRQ